jgi:D-serine deaminase-like pyridoxal phosphate-dependent protein
MKYSSVLKENNVRLPAAFVDLAAFDQNLRRVAETVAQNKFPIRVATKSIRVPELIRRALAFGAPYKGLMCYSAYEAAFLAQQGFDDFLIAYPTLHPAEIKSMIHLQLMGKKVYLVVDDVRHLEAIDSAMKVANARDPFEVVVEIDLAVRLSSLVLGVRRSPLRSVDQIINFIGEIKKFKNLKFKGFMAYEAQVAGLGDNNPFKALMNIAVRPFRKWSMSRIIQKRKDLLKACRTKGITVELFNGGGTGSTLMHNAEVGVLTELTVGSGFLCSHLFDYYTNFKPEAAGFFAVQAVRQPEADWYTCAGGGYVASGEPGLDRLPRPLASGMKLSTFEGAGEVQTPVHSDTAIALGDPVVFRPAKAGEWLERFNEIHFIENNKITKTVKTYRGFGECYF